MIRRTLFSIVVSLTFLFFGSEVTAQVLEEVSFQTKIHDFGHIEESAGPVEYSFTFTNTSAGPIKISDVKASCGCTTPGWSKEAVPRGGEGFVAAKYDPTNRPGPFDKTLTVTIDGTTTYVLRIKGQVNPKPRTIEDDLPTLMGNLRVQYRAFNVGRVFSNGATTKEFVVYNAAEAPITFADSLDSPSHIAVQIEPRILQPKEKGVVIVTFDAKAKNDLGFTTDNVTLYTDEAEEGIKSFSVYANIEEYFAPLTPEELAKAPRLTFGKVIYDFGRIEIGQEVTTEFIVKNEGLSELKLRQIKSTCACLVAEASSMSIMPGEQAEVKVTFNSTGRRGNQQKSISVFSNDPKAPTQRLTIKASIE